MRKFNRLPCSIEDIVYNSEKARLAGWDFAHSILCDIGELVFHNGDLYKYARRAERLMLYWWMRGIQSAAWKEGNESGQPTYHHKDYPEMNPFGEL